MVDRQKDGRYHVLVRVWPNYKQEHTIPCRKLECPVCSRLQGMKVDRGFAEKIEREFEDALKAERKSKGSLTSSGIRYIKDALTRYREKRDNDLGKQESTYKRLLDNLGDHRLDSSWTATDEFVNSYKDEFKPASINRHIAMLKAAIHECYETRVAGGTRLIADNYLSSFPLLEEQNIEYLILSKEQQDKFWATLDPRLKPFTYFAWRCPIREGEAFNLTREHVRPFEKIIKLPYEYTKQGDLRTIPIIDELMPYTMEWYQSPATYYFNRGPEQGYAPLGYLSKGKVEFSLKKAWAKACAAAGELRYNMHKCRQQAVMSLWQQGWTQEEIRLFGGWSMATSRGKDAFYSYFNKDQALSIRKGHLSLDLTWQKRYAEDLRKAA